MEMSNNSESIFRGPEGGMFSDSQTAREEPLAERMPQCIPMLTKKRILSRVATRGRGVNKIRERQNRRIRKCGRGTLKMPRASWKSVCPKIPGNSEAETKKIYLKIVRGAIANLNNTIRAQAVWQINYKQIYTMVNYFYEGREGEGEEDSDDEFRQVLNGLLLAHLKGQIQENQIYCDKVIEQIKRIIIAFKKMRKRNRKDKTKTGVSLVAIEKEQKIAHNSGYLSDSSSIQQEDPSDRSSSHFPLQRDYKSDLGKQRQEVQLQETARITRGPVIVVQEESQIKAILLEAGLLCVQPSPIPDSDNDVQTQNSKWLMRADEFEGSNGFSCFNDDLHHFYDENELDGNCYWKINLCVERESN